MAKAMKGIAKKYPAKETEGTPAIPEMKNFRLGLNVASCDGLPNVVVFGKDEEQVAELKEKLAQVIFDDGLASKFIFASATDAKEFKEISGAEKVKQGFLVIEADSYGMKGKLLKSLDAKASADEMKKELAAVVKEFTRVKKSHHTHVRNGKRNGENWETEVPITDPMTLRAMGGRNNRRDK